MSVCVCACVHVCECVYGEDQKLCISLVTDVLQTAVYKCSIECMQFISHTSKQAEVSHKGTNVDHIVVQTATVPHTA